MVLMVVIVNNLLSTYEVPGTGLSTPTEEDNLVTSKSVGVTGKKEVKVKTEV